MIHVLEIRKHAENKEIILLKKHEISRCTTHHVKGHDLFGVKVVSLHVNEALNLTVTEAKRRRGERVAYRRVDVLVVR